MKSFQNPPTTMRNILSLLTGATLSFSGVNHLHAQNNIEFLNIENMTVNEACRMISFATGQSITPTSDSRDKECSVLMRNVTIEDAISKVCVSSGLVYRKDNVHGGYLVMSIKEYQENIIVSAGERIRIFDVEPANVSLIAESIQALYPNDTVLQESEGVVDFQEPVETSESGSGSGGGSGGRTGSNGINGRSTSNNSRGFAGGRGSQFGGSDGNQLTQLQALDSETTEQGTVGERSAPSASSIFVITNLEHNQVIIRTANEEAILQIEELVKQIDKPISQVLLEMKILNLNIGEEEEAGVGWNFQDGPDVNGLGRRSEFSTFNLASTTASSFVYDFLIDNIQARVNLLASDNNVEVLATPMLVATNNRAAEINVGQERVIIVGASTSDVITGGTNSTTNRVVQAETEVRTIGTSLRIIPRINPNDTVTLNVEQASTNVLVGNNTIPLGAGDAVPIDSVDTAEVRATVVASNHKTIAVGGLIRTETSDNNTKVPVLGDVPILGKAFRQNDKGTTKSELILLITPHIMRNDEDSVRTTQELLANQSDHSYVLSGPDHLNRHNPELARHRADHGKSSVSAHSSGMLPRKPSHSHGAKGHAISSHYNDVKPLPEKVRKKFFARRKR